MFEKLLPAFPDARITVLTVFNEDWDVMTGDDWLNTSATRNTFRSHVETQLARETEAHWETIRERYPAASRHRFMHVFGPVEETFAEVARKRQLRPGGDRRLAEENGQRVQTPGFKPAKLHPMLTIPLMIAP